MKILGLIVALSIALVACGSDNSGSDTSSSGGSGSGNSQVCSAVDDVQSSVTKVQDLNSSSTVSDVTNALSGVEQAGRDLANAIQAAPSPDLSGLQSSVQSLSNALKAVPSSSSVQAGLQAVEKAADSVASEAQTTADSVGCS